MSKIHEMGRSTGAADLSPWKEALLVPDRMTFKTPRYDS